MKQNYTNLTIYLVHNAFYLLRLDIKVIIRVYNHRLPIHHRFDIIGMDFDYQDIINFENMNKYHVAISSPVRRIISQSNMFKSQFLLCRKPVMCHV